MGWAVRAGQKVGVRLAEASKRFGEVQHIAVGVPSKWWGLPVSTLRKKVDDGMRVRGVVGGFLIFHGFRYNNPLEARMKNQLVGWYWSPHYHVLGFILGGYKCRSCKKIEASGKCGIENRGCDGFVNRNFRENEKDGLYFKVEGKRKTVSGTASYILNHASIRKGVKRPHAGVWFGVCSYRELKLSPVERKAVCPICGHDLVKLRYFGRENLDLRWGAFVVVFGEGGVALWVECEEERKKYWE
jgi:hypothetical protein